MLNRSDAKAVAEAVMRSLPQTPRLKSIQLWPTRHDGVLTIKIYFHPLNSKESPEPQEFIFEPKELEHG